MYTIYALQDPRDQSVHYIGISKEAYRRYAMHLLNTGGSKTAKDAWIQALREEGISPIISLLEGVETKKEANERESYWIQHYLSLNASLTNMVKNPKVVHPPKSTTEQILTEEEKKLKDLLREHGWGLLVRKRRERTFYYAIKWKEGQVYITSASKLPQLTPEEVMRKIKVS